MPNDLSVEDIDKILQDLENSLEIRTSEQAANVFEIKDAKEHFSGADSSLLRFDLFVFMDHLDYTAHRWISLHPRILLTAL